VAVGVLLARAAARDAVKPPAGEHRFRVKLECASERLAVADAVLGVRAGE